MRFSDAELALLDETRDIRIETSAPDGGTHRTIIWIMVDGGEVFVRSVNGSTARWYREATAEPAIDIHAASRTLAATALPATDPDSVRRTNDALTRKYAGSGGYESMLKPDVFDTTLRLIPR
jgi:hypothetical protein